MSEEKEHQRCSADSEGALETAYLTIIKLTERDNNDVVNDEARGVCSFLETEARAKIFKDTLVALRDLRRTAAPAQPALETAPLRLCGYCKSWNSKPCGEGCCWSPTDPTIMSDAIEAMRKALNYIENTEGEFGIKLSCGDALREALAAQPPAAPVETKPFYGAQCPTYPNCSGGCGLGCTHEVKQHQSCSADTVEEIAKWLHDETEHPDSYPDHTWPETDRDGGRREGGWVKIVPQHAQAYFRDIARRLVARFIANEPHRSGGLK